MESDIILPSLARTIIYDFIARATFYKTYHRLPTSFRNTSECDHEMAAQANMAPRTDSRSKGTDNHDDILLLLRNILSSMTKIEKRREERHLDEVIKCEWKESANVLDRMFMAIYLIALFCILATFLGLLPNYNRVH
jgi:hypothetical protein